MPDCFSIFLHPFLSGTWATFLIYLLIANEVSTGFLLVTIFIFLEVLYFAFLLWDLETSELEMKGGDQ